MTSPRVLLKAWGLHPKKQLGQNFLSDPAAARMIVDHARISPDDTVLEIGAGLGALTIPLARRAKSVYAVEKDPQLAALLKNELLVQNAGNVVLINENILSLDIRELSGKAGGTLRVLGNLPYNLSSQILIQLIQARSAVSRAVLMFQKELAQRLAAEPGCKAYGRLTVMLRYCADIRTVADVKAHQFFPRPKVDSVVLGIDFKAPAVGAVPSEKQLFALIKAAFSRRRKTLKNALSKSDLHMDAAAAGQLLEAAGIDPVRRAETLSVEEFVTLNHFYSMFSATDTVRSPSIFT